MMTISYSYIEITLPFHMSHVTIVVISSCIIYFSIFNQKSTVILQCVLNVLYFDLKVIMIFNLAVVIVNL